MNLSEWGYNVLLHAAMPLGVVGTYVGFRGRDPDAHTGGKFQAVPHENLPEEARVWIHGASVGEMGLVKLLLDILEEGGTPPGEVVVSTQTLSGLSSIDHPHRFLLPHDYPSLLNPIVRRLSPDHLFVVETEIWPNLFRLNRERLTLVNARMEEDTFRWYSRFRGIFNASLGYCSRILSRSEQDAKRFRSLAPKRVPVESVGSLKWIQFLAAPDPLPEGYPRFSGGEGVLVAGSTRPGEEEFVLNWLERRSLRAYLAPRHLKRLSEVSRLLDEHGITWRRWSESEGLVDVQVILIDVIGHLASLYGAGDLAFVGGTWNPSVGAHNLMEPARFGIPVLVGPHHENVRGVARRLEEEGLLHEFSSTADSLDLLARLEREGFGVPEGAVESLRGRARTIRDRYRQRTQSALVPAP